MRQFTLDLPHQPWCGPNGRSWRRRHEHSQAWKHAVHVLARAEQLPRLEKATVTLRCRPGPPKRYRDVDGLALVVKWCTDGLVQAGVLDGDDFRFVPEVKLQMEPPSGSWRWLLIVRELP